MVSDAIEALYIIDELSNTGNISGAVSNETISKLADKITLLKNERFFDTRIYRKRVMTELLAFLNENDLIAANNIDAYNIINDYHFQAELKARESGSRLNINITPSIALLQEKRENFINETEEISRGYNKGGRIEIAYLATTPLSTKWQSTLSSRLLLNGSLITYTTANTNHYYNRFIQPDYTSAYASYSLEYFPNTRTSLSGTLLSHINNNESLINWRNTLNLSAYYYISERLRINGGFNLSKFNILDQVVDVARNELTKEYQTRFHQTFNLSLNYFIL